MALKEAYTTLEMMQSLGIVKTTVMRRAKNENWHARPRAGRGGGNEWLLSSMPDETRLVIRRAEEERALALVEPHTPTALPATVVTPTRTIPSAAILDDSRRAKALAKADLLSKYLQWQKKHGATRAQKAEFVNVYLSGAWGQLLTELGKNISWKSLERWKLEQERAGTVLALADKRGLACRGRSLLTEQHRMLILGHALNPNAPKPAQCARKVQDRCKALDIYVPSAPTICRFISAYSAECFDEFTLWREGKKAWNDKCAISILRDWSLVDVGDIVIADGHTLNFETINPETGKPCRMTLLLFYDGASNHPLGWEIMASENVACISAAFRRTCLLLGKFPRIIYLDNGRAFRAKFFKGCEDFEQAGFLGLYRELGCDVIHAWAYHGQSKPVERFFGTMHDMEIWMPSYTGNDIAHKPARMKRGEPLHRKLYDKLGGRPLTLEETHTEVARWFCDYAHRAQFGLHMQGRTPAQIFAAGRGAGLTQADAERMTLLMMQKEVRILTKDGFRLNGRLYWHEKLASRRHPVLVRYDEQLSPHEVKVYTLDGEPLCVARDRAHYGIACGLHPAASILGTEEQRQALEAALTLKKGQEKQSSAALRTMLETVVQPETQARFAAFAQAGQAATATPALPKAKPLTQAQRQAVEDAKAQGRAALAAAPSYTPSSLRRFRDEAERYHYLFTVLYEQGLPLVPEDAAWVEYFENSAEYQRNYKKRYEGLRELYAFRASRAASA